MSFLLGAGLAFLAGLWTGVLILGFDLRGLAFFAALLGLLLALSLAALSLAALSLAALSIVACGLAALAFLTALAFFFAGFFRGLVLLSNQGRILGLLDDGIKAIRRAACGWQSSFRDARAW